jgi:hypothetical protein
MFLAFARPAPGAIRYPASSLLFSPPTPWPPSVSAPVPLAFDLPLRRMLLLGRDTRAPAFALPSEIGSTGSPSCRCSPEEWSGSPRLLGRPLRARHGQTPRQVCHAPRPVSGHGTAAFRNMRPLGTWELAVSWPYPRGSHVRRPTHHRDGYPQRRKALLPACRAQLWPGGFRTHWTTYRISAGIATSFPFGPALPGRFSCNAMVTSI